MDRRGLSLVELLIAAAILSIVLGLLITYFVQQSNLTSQVQARNEVQDKVRMVMQLVTQDLQMAGASVYLDTSGAIVSGVFLDSCLVISCLESSSSGGGSAARDTFGVQYISSLRSVATACRRVAYDFDGEMLRRSDVDCDEENDAFHPIGNNIQALDIVYVCSNGNEVDDIPDASDCPVNTAYPRSARVTVVGRSDARVRGQESRTFETVGGQTVTCPEGFICYAMTQEVQMPNLKDR